MSLVIENLKDVGGNLVDADWSVEDPEQRGDLHLIAENLGYKIVNIYNQQGGLAMDDCTFGTLFLEPIN